MYTSVKNIDGQNTYAPLPLIKPNIARASTRNIATNSPTTNVGVVAVGHTGWRQGEESLPCKWGDHDVLRGPRPAA